MVMQIAFIGLGEAATAFISGWSATQHHSIRAFDIKSLNAETSNEITNRAKALGIEATASAKSALVGAELVFSTVTADQAVAAAESYAPDIEKDALWCDLNSCAPESKRQAAEVIKNAGGRYLDVAVMAPVNPKKNMVPCLLSGPGAEDESRVLEALPMSVSVVGTQVGRASAIKLVRSIMVKGLEALTAECALAAVAAGVADDVFPSLKDGHPQIDVPTRAAYNLERMVVHGERRAAEMDECATMLTNLGLPNDMARSTAQWQRQVASFRSHFDDNQTEDWELFLDKLLRDLRSDC